MNKLYPFACKVLFLFAAISLMNAAKSQNVPEMMYYKFDGNAQNFASAPVGTNPATITGLATTGTGQFNNGLVGNGGTNTSNNVNTGWPLNLGASDWTISLWLNNFPATAATTQYFFGGGGGSAFRCFTGGVAGNNALLLRATGMTDVPVTAIGSAPIVIHFVHETTPANVIKVYRNGVLANTVSQATPLNITGTDFWVGAYSGTTTAFSAGTIMDEFRMYNRALDASEVAASWNIELPGAPCTSPPIPGSATSSVSAPVCTGNAVNLNLTGQSSGSGQTYRWLSGPSATGPWTYISSASTASGLTVNPTATTWYHAEVTCGASTLPSTPVEVQVNPPFAAGTYTINSALPASATNFQSFAAAVNAINCGVAGNVVFNVVTDQVFIEDIPVINPIGSSSGTITFQKSGAGANPKITPATQGTIASSTTVGSNGDGVIILNGTDYITFDGIDIDASAGFSGNGMFEYGYFLKKASGTDACKNVVIKNSTITLVKTAVHSFGIYVSNISGTASITVTSTGGRAENIKIFNNTINGCYDGINVTGFSGASPYDLYDQNIEIGVDGPNIIDQWGGGSTTTYGIYGIYQNNLKVANNTITSSPGTTTTMYGIFLTTGTNSNVDIFGNTVTIIGGGTTSSVYAIYNAMGSTGTNNTVKIYNNTVTNCTYPSATSGAMYLIYQGASAFKSHIYSNNLTNNIHTPTTTGAMYCLYQAGGVVNESKIYSNTISNNQKSTGTTGSVYYIYNSPSATANGDIYSNVVSVNSSINTTGGILYGIAQTSGATTNIYKNRIFDITSNSAAAGGSIYGISISGGTTNNVYNNFISDLKAASISSADAIRGISVSYTTASTSINVSYNTVYLNAISGGANFGTSAVYHTVSATATTATLTLRNNNLVNISTPNGTGITAAFRRSGVALNNYGSASDRNNLYAGSGNPASVLFYDGTNSDATLSAYKARMTPRDGGSVSEDPPFVDVSAPPYNLDIKTTIATQLESGGIPVSGITDDFYGTARNATTPDIGAHEFVGIPADFTGPSISYTTLTNTICLQGPTLTATITDASGVNTTAGTKPRLWFKKSGEADVLPATNTSASNGWKWVEASNASSPFTFTIDYSLLSSPIATGDSITYFVVAQDLAATPNVGVGVATFSAAPTTVALSAGVFPTNTPINGYNVLVVPAPITIAASSSELCVSGTVTLNVSGTSVPGAGYQWQSSPAGANTWSDIAGATTLPYTTATINASTDFRLAVSCNATPVAGSPTAPVTVNVNNPQVTTTTPGNRCGVGTVDLGATASPGSVLNWFTTASGGTPVGTGTTFTTPSISTTTTYYVSATSTAPGTPDSVALPLSSANTTGSYHHMFLVHSLTGITMSGLGIKVNNTVGTMTSWDVYYRPDNYQTIPGSNTSSAGWTLISSQVNIPSKGTGDYTQIAFGLNIDIPAGAKYSFYVVPVGGSTHQYATTALGTTVASNTDAAIIAGNRGTALFNVGTSGGVPAAKVYYSLRCGSARTAVTATVTPAPALTVTADKTICNNAIQMLEVTSTVGDFNSYIWSPQTGLYTDAAATVAYTGGSATQVYVKSTTGGATTYTVNALNTTSNCANTATTTVTIMPDATISATPQEICISGSSLLSLSPNTGYGTGTFQWQSSPDGTTYTDIPAATAVTYTTPSVTQTSYYRMVLKDGAGATCATMPAFTLTVNNPQITSTTPGSRCGPGTVALSATGSAGTTLKWYEAASGGVDIGVGGAFTTPSISTTTTYYVGASLGGGASMAAPMPVQTTTQAGNVRGYWFTAPISFRITGLRDMGTGAGPQNIAVVKFNTGVTPPTYSAVTNSFTTLFLTQGNAVSGVIPVNIQVNAGDVIGVLGQRGTGTTAVTSYGTPNPYNTTIGGQTVALNRMGMQFPLTTNPPKDLWQEPTSTNIGRIEMTYDVACEGPRTAVTATVNNAVSSAAGAAGTTECATATIAGTTDFNYTDCDAIAVITPSGASPISGSVDACVKIDASVQTAPTGEPYVQRHYDITPASNPTTATSTITLYFLQSEFNAFNAVSGFYAPLPATSGDAAGKANLRITQYNGTGTAPGNYTGTAVQIDPADANITWNSVVNRWEVTFDATGAGGFYVHTGQFVLPVTGLELKGEQAGTVNKLSWLTKTEINNKGFEVQRSANGVTFSSLAFVASKAENGNSTSAFSYNYNDDKPFAGNSYYRLKQMDKDGRISYSNVVLISRKVTDITLSGVYPNPTTRELNVVIVSPKAERVTIVVTDLSGKLVMQQSRQLIVGENQAVLNVQSLAAGTYVVKAVCADGCESAVHRFVKQ